MSGMKIIKPLTVTSATLLSSSVAEPDAASGEVIWNPATNYALGAAAIRTTTHRKYERKVPGVSATPPENDTVNWFDAAPTNRYGMFDRKVGTITSAPTSLTVVMQPGGTSGLGVLEVVGRNANVTMRNAPGGSIVYQKPISLDGTIIESVYDWFFNEFEQLTDFVLTDLPQHYTNAEITVEITGTSGVSVGVLQVGQVIEVGKTLKGASVGIIDFSQKQADKYGNRDFVEGEYSKRNSLQILTEKRDFNKIYRRLASLRATPCIYIGTEEAGYEPMIVYGAYKDFSIVVAYQNHHLCNIEIEGL